VSTRYHAWQSLRRFRALLLALLVMTIASITTVALTVTPAVASITNTRADAWGTLELSGSSWLNGAGVDVKSNGASVTYTPDKPTNTVTTPSGSNVQSGEKWQCVELVNRLYLSKGWISSRWTGNGGQMYNNAPNALTKEVNGSIVNLKAGDVIVLQDGGAGHVGIVNSVSGSTVSIVNQNTVAVYSSATLSGGTLTMSGWSSYTVKGVVHSPSSLPPTSTPTPTPPPPPADSPSSTNTVQNQSSGMTQVFVQGPNNSLQTYYWQTGIGWDGPYQIAGSGTTYSAPSAIQLQPSGMVQVFVQGPSSTLETYYWSPGIGWNSYQIAGIGTTYSAPTATQNQSNGMVQVFAEGTSNSLQTYWWQTGIGWDGPYQIAGSGTTYSEPSAVQFQSSGMVQVFAEGASNTLETYYWSPGVGWNSYQIAGSGTTYSAPTATQNQSNGMVQVFAQGLSNSLQSYYWSPGIGWNSYQIAGSSATYSVPGAVQLQSSGMVQVFVQGPSNTLETYYWSPGVGWALYQIAGSGTTY
jgi:acylphosphatase